MFWNKKAGWFGKQLDEHIKALNNGDYGRIPWIFCVFSEEHSPSKQVASKALDHILNQLQFDDIIRIDTQMRQTTSMEWSIDWRKLKIDSFFTSEMNINERRAVIIFASFNPNGFIREQAVHMMCKYNGTLPFIILRQNDWVVQVRQAATKAFDKRLQNLSTDEILSALPFAEKLKWCIRGSHGEYTQKFYNKLISPEHKEDLSKGLQSNNVRTRRICVHAMLDASRPDTERAFRQLRCEHDPFLRQIIYEKLRQLGQDMTEASYVFLQDKYPTNRVLALQYFYDTQENDILDIASKLLLDRNTAVRELARKIVQEYAPEFDVQAFYAESLERDAVAAILGTGEIGQIHDAERIEKYLCDSRISVVRATMVSLIRLDKVKYSDKVLEMLADSRVGVVKTAQQLVIKYGIMNYDRVHEIFIDTPFEYTKIKCAVILFSASKWQSLVYMLEALSCNMEIVREFTMQSIRKWLFTYNKSFVEINGQQKIALLELINYHQEKIPASIERELLFVLK